jgi:hypothetical protein
MPPSRTTGERRECMSEKKVGDQTDRVTDPS